MLKEAIPRNDIRLYGIKKVDIIKLKNLKTDKERELIYLYIRYNYTCINYNV